MAENFFQLDIYQFDAEKEEILYALAFDAGATGVQEILEYHQDTGDYSPEIVKQDVKNYTLYFERLPSSSALERIYALDGEASYRYSKMDNKDWNEEWKKGFTSFDLVGEFGIVPSWEENKHFKKPIYIDPGMAFGTGTHETTKIVSAFLASFDQRPARIFDIGTGTGILAILANKLFDAEIVANDIDEISLEVAQENLNKNNSSNVRLTKDSISNETGEFDLVIANIIHMILLKLKDEIVSKTKPGGHIMLSGILDEDKEEFLDKFLEGTDLEYVVSMTKGEWFGVCLRKKP